MNNTNKIRYKEKKPFINTMNHTKTSTNFIRKRRNNKN